MHRTLARSQGLLRGHHCPNARGVRGLFDTAGLQQRRLEQPGRRSGESMAQDKVRGVNGASISVRHGLPHAPPVSVLRWLTAVVLTLLRVLRDLDLEYCNTRRVLEEYSKSTRRVLEEYSEL